MAKAGDLVQKLKEKNLVDIKLVEAHSFQKDNLNANKCIADMLNLITHRYVSYVGNPKLMNNVMSEIKISTPSHIEQQKIADFLSSIDDKITKIEGKLTKAQTFKKGLLQQMFV